MWSSEELPLCSTQASPAAHGAGGKAFSPLMVGTTKAAFNQSLPLHLFSGWMYAPSSPARADLVK